MFWSSFFLDFLCYSSGSGFMNLGDGIAGNAAGIMHEPGVLAAGLFADWGVEYTPLGVDNPAEYHGSVNVPPPDFDPAGFNPAGPVSFIISKCFNALTQSLCNI